MDVCQVCAAIILWFLVPIFWSWRFASPGPLLILSTASTVTLNRMEPAYLRAGERG